MWFSSQVSMDCDQDYVSLPHSSSQGHTSVNKYQQINKDKQYVDKYV